MYSLKKKTKDTGKSYRDEHIAENYKILKRTFFNSVCWYDIIHCCIKYEGACTYIYRNFAKKKNMSQYRIISICQRDINIINCAQDGASLITKERAVEKKNEYLIQHQGRTNKMDSEHLKNCV